MLQQRSNRWLALFFVIGLFLFVWLNWFPPGGEAEENAVSVSDNVGKDVIAVNAVDFVRGQFGAGAWESFPIYDAYDTAQGYFTKEKLLDDYDKYWSASIPSDYYRVQVKDQQNEREFNVYVKLADGSVFGWEEVDAPYEAVSPDQRKTAEAMVQHMGYDLSQFEPAKDAGESEFVFLHKKRVGEAEFALHLRMSGEAVASFQPVIEVPESFSDWKEQQDSKGAITSMISLLLWFGLAIAAVVYMAVYRSKMSFGRGIWLTLAFLAPYLMYNVNMYPGIKLSVGSMDQAAVFGILFSQFLMMLMGASVYVCLVAGDGLWRRMGHDLWTHHHAPSFGSAVMRGVGLGYVFCVIILGLQSALFFAAGELFDVWFGVDPMLSSNNLLWPGLYPLLGWSAAISEEAVFRIFAIAFFTVIIRPIWRWVARLTSRPIFLHPLFYLIPAITIANLLWALGHTSYSVYPVYTRLFEVAILGYVFSYLFLRYGLIAAIFAHATMDILIMGLESMMNDSRYVIPGLLYMFMPLIVGLLIKWFASMRKKIPPANPADGPAPDYPPTLP